MSFTANSLAMQSLLAAQAINNPRNHHLSVEDRNILFVHRPIRDEYFPAGRPTKPIRSLDLCFDTSSYQREKEFRIRRKGGVFVSHPSMTLMELYRENGCVGVLSDAWLAERKGSKKKARRILDAYYANRVNPFVWKPTRWSPDLPIFGPDPKWVSQIGKTSIMSKLKTIKEEPYLTDEQLLEQIHKRNINSHSAWVRAQAREAKKQKEETHKKEQKQIDRDASTKQRRDFKATFFSQVGFNITHKIHKDTSAVMQEQMNKITKIIEESGGDIAKASLGISAAAEKGVGIADHMKVFFWICLATVVAALFATSKVSARPFLVILLSTLLPAGLWAAISKYFEIKMVNQGPLDLTFLGTMVCTMMTFFAFGGGKLFQSTSNIFRNLGGYTRTCSGINDLGNYISGCIEWCINQFRKLFGKDPIRVFKTGKEDIDSYINKVDEIILEANSGKETSDDFLDSLLVLRRMGAELSEKRRWNIIYERAISKANAAVDKVISFHSAAIQGFAGARQEPVVLALRGDPGVGKSFLMLALSEVFVPAIIGPELVAKEGYTANQYTFTKNSVTEYWTGHGPNCKVTCLDDWGQSKPVPGVESCYSELISLVSPYNCQLNMAEVEAKGKSFFKDPLIMLTTNLKGVGLSEAVIVSTEAVCRRLQHSFEMRVHPNYTIPGTERLDGNKVSAERASTGKFPFHAFQFRRWDFSQGAPDAHSEEEEITAMDIMKEIMAAINRNKQRKIQHIDNKQELVDLGLTFFSQGGGHSKSDCNSDSEEEYETRSTRKPAFRTTTEEVELEPDIVSHKIDFDKPIKEYPRQLPRKGVPLIKVLKDPIMCSSVQILGHLRRDLKSDVTPLHQEVLRFFKGPFFELLMFLIGGFIGGVILVNFIKIVVGLLVKFLVKPALGLIHKKAKKGTVRHDKRTLAYVRRHIGQVSAETLKSVASLLEADTLVDKKVPDPEIADSDSSDSEMEGDENPIFKMMSANIFGGMKDQSNEPTPTTKSKVKSTFFNQGGAGRAEELLEGLNRNQFLVTVTTVENGPIAEDGSYVQTTKENSPGILTVLENDFCLFPNHIVDGLQRDVLKGIHERKSKVKLTNLYSPNHIAELELGQLLDRRLHTDVEKDVAILKLPTLQKRRSIVSKFVNNADLSGLSRVDIRVETVVLKTKVPTNLVRYGKATRIDRIEVDRVSPRLVLDGWLYDIATTFGDCGGLVTLLDNSWTGCRKIIGFHTGGDSVRGLAVGITQDYIRELLDSLGSIREDREFPVLPEKFVSQSSAGEHLTVVPKELSVSLCPKTSLFPTPLYNCWGEFDFKPALLSKKGFINPMANIRNKYLHHPVTMPLGQVRRAAFVAFRPFYRASVNDYRGILTFKEAVAGKKEIEYCKGLPRGTSSGWPFNVKPCAGKKVFFGAQDEYTFNSPEAIQLEQDVNRLEELAKQRIRGFHVYTDFLKDELRSEAKVEAGETRLISACPLAYAILFRKYFMAFTASVQKHRIETGPAIGINVYNEWTRLAKHLRTKGPYIVAGDYKGFDYTANPDVHDAILDMIQTWYGDEHRNIREVLWKELTNSIHIGGDGDQPSNQIYAMVGIMPSGFPGTSIINCFDNLINMIMAFEELSLHEAEDFWEYVAMVVYGDDNLLSIHPDCIGDFNQNTIPLAMTNYGRKYTNDRKDDLDTPDYRSIEDVTFLKREFVRHGHIYKAPLALESILTIPYWCGNRKDATDIMRKNVENALEELSLHDSATWSQYAPVIANAALKRLHYVTKRRVEQEDYFAAVQLRTDYY